MTTVPPPTQEKYDLPPSDPPPLSILQKLESRSYGHLKTADSYTLKNFDNFGKYAISVNMEAFTSGKVRQDYYAPANQLTHRSMNQFWYVSTIKGVVRLS